MTKFSIMLIFSCWMFSAGSMLQPRSDCPNPHPQSTAHMAEELHEVTENNTVAIDALNKSTIKIAQTLKHLDSVIDDVTRETITHEEDIKELNRELRELNKMVASHEAQLLHLKIESLKQEMANKPTLQTNLLAAKEIIIQSAITGSISKALVHLYQKSMPTPRPGWARFICDQGVLLAATGVGYMAASEYQRPSLDYRAAFKNVIEFSKRAGQITQEILLPPYPEPEIHKRSSHRVCENFMTTITPSAHSQSVIPTHAPHALGPVEFLSTSHPPRNTLLENSLASCQIELHSLPTQG